jgi:hypothetical protein
MATIIPTLLATRKWFVSLCIAFEEEVGKARYFIVPAGIFLMLVMLREGAPAFQQIRQGAGFNATVAVYMKGRLILSPVWPLAITTGIWSLVCLLFVSVSLYSCRNEPRRLVRWIKSRRPNLQH